MIDGQTANTHSPLVAQLHADYEVARHAAFAVFARVALEQRGLLPAALCAQGGRPATPDHAQVQAALAGLAGTNPHLVAAFRSSTGAVAMPPLRTEAVDELVGWCAAQHVEREAPQVAYELGMLALGIELPGILVGSLRALAVAPDTTVVELPDGGGYPTVFLATLHAHWTAARQATLFVEGADAETLAGWALAVLNETAAPAGRVVHVTQATAGRFRDSSCDVALVYNPVGWLGAGGTDAAAYVRAKQVVLL